ncbi:MAG: DUF1801 domain-containing protein [Saprospiraceae bacterium]
MNSKVSIFISESKQWRAEMEALRSILLDCGLEEEVKWSKPCYTLAGKNIAVIQPFKDYCALLFMKGYLLKDKDNILVKTSENTRVGRQARFTEVQDIYNSVNKLTSIIREAIEVEKSGKKEEKIEKSKPEFTKELTEEFEKDLLFDKAFNDLTPGRQLSWIFYFASAKQSSTCISRIEKCKKKIFEGKGYNEY